MDIANLMEKFIFGVTYWKWLVLAVSFVGLYFLRTLILWLCHKIKKAQARFSEKSFLYYFFEQKIEKPISWVFIATFSFALVEYLNMPEGLTKYLSFFLKLLMTFNVIRLCYLAAEAFGEALQEWALHTESHFDDQLAPFASRTLKVVVIVIGILVGLQNFGVNVTALLAGLGIGGVALAFAAQDTVSNVFGTITIILDRPFKLGDQIKIGETEGTIEEVGFRSTRIRTHYNSVVSIPNSLVAKERIDNLSERNGWLRFRQMLTFTVHTKIENINEFIEHLRYQLLQEPTIDNSRTTIHMNNLNDSNLNVLVNFHYQLNTDEKESVRINTYLELIYNTALEKKLIFAVKHN